MTPVVTKDLSYWKNFLGPSWAVKNCGLPDLQGVYVVADPENQLTLSRLADPENRS
jgi:hypothetical protein